MVKDFDDLTIVDDYMFYRVMENMDISKRLLNIVLHDQTYTITDIQLQKMIADAGTAKGVRFDVWAKDCNGTIYDVEMQAINKDDLARRIRYYQSAIDVSILEKNKPYEALPDSFIIFFCTFDYLGKGLPVYTFKTLCTENTHIHLDDGITKIIINSKAAEKEANSALKNFLQYMNGKKVNDDEFIRQIEQRIKEVKESEELRREYMLINTFERDARHDGWKSGWKDGMQQGIRQGFADGAYQKALETAKILKQLHCELSMIIQSTGLSQEEIEKL